MRSEVITVVCWKWEPYPGYRSKFTAEHVNTFARMVRRNYRGRLELVCVTDDPGGITECDRILPLWEEFASIPSPHDTPTRRRNPSCYRRLRMFARDAGAWLGTRIVSMDLDCVVTGDLAPIFDRKEPFIVWGDTNPTTYYNGGLISFDAGAVPQVYEQFKSNPEGAIAKAQRLKQFGSDQGWIGACLGASRPKYSTAHGVYSYRVHIKQGFNGRLPNDARLVMFHGQVDPEHDEAQRLPWVREHYR